MERALSRASLMRLHASSTNPPPPPGLKARPPHGVGGDEYSILAGRAMEGMRIDATKHKTRNTNHETPLTKERACGEEDFDRKLGLLDRSV